MAGAIRRVRGSAARPEVRVTPRRVTGDWNMWVFVLGDLLIFSVYFVTYLIDRNRHHAAFLVSQRQLDVDIGALNTVVLLTSSLLMARGVLAARAGRQRRAAGYVLACAACGLLFMLVKAGEWTAEVLAGHTFPSTDFFMYYYMLTGIHLFHVALGLVFSAIVVVELRTPARSRIAVVETGAIYWHMVDLLWLVIFALVYVIR